MISENVCMLIGYRLVIFVSCAIIVIVYLVLYVWKITNYFRICKYFCVKIKEKDEIADVNGSCETSKC